FSFWSEDPAMSLRQFFTAAGVDPAIGFFPISEIPGHPETPMQGLFPAAFPAMTPPGGNPPPGLPFNNVIVSSDPPGIVAQPATFWSLGIGLLGLFIYGRR